MTTRTLGEVPAVCVRLPTGGGKTTARPRMPLARIGRVFLAQRRAGGAVADAVGRDPQPDAGGAALGRAMPAMPGAGRALRRRRAGLRAGRVGDGRAAGDQQPRVIVVATIQSFNVSDTSERNVYAFDESLAPHFQALSPQQAARLEA
jgi:type III restriction enzyme